MCVGRGGIRHEGRWLLLVVSERGYHLRGVGVVVVAHVRQRDLRRVQVLEGNVHRLERHFELIHLRGEKAAELGKFRTQNGDSPRLATRVSKKEGRPERRVLQSSASEIVASHSFDFEARRAPLGCVSPHRGGAFRPSNHCHIKQLILSDPLLDPKDVGPKQTVAQANQPHQPASGRTPGT